MRQALVIGCGGHSRFVLSTLMQSCPDVCVRGILSLDKPTTSGELVLGHAVIDWYGNLEEWHSEGVSTVFIAVGDNRRRRAIFDELAAREFLIPSVIHPTASLGEGVEVGQGNIVGPNAVLGACVEIADNCIVNTGAVVEHETRVGSHAHLAPASVLCGRVKIGDQVLVGANATVVPGVNIAEGVVLGAGAVAVNDLAVAHGVYAGVPARIAKRLK